MTASRQDALLEDERNSIRVFQAVGPLVVNITTMQYARVGFFSFDVTEVPAGNGSGFLWDKAGHVVTNYHVIDRADEILVSFADGKALKARVVGAEPRKDISVLKLERRPDVGRGVQLARSAELQPGQKTIAIGSPFGFDQTLTTGIVSALGRSIQGVGGVTIRDMIQTDASINPGNSGGPLLSSRGEVMGMNTVIYSQSGSSAGVGFAVPSDTIRRVVSQIIRYGRVRQPGLGIAYYPDRIARRLGIEGVLVQAVQPGGAAEKAGLQGTRRDRRGDIRLGDIIVAVGEDEIKSYDDLYNSLEGRKIGARVAVKVRRGRGTQKLTVRLQDVGAD